MYGLKPEEIAQIQRLLARYPKVEKALLYGSRAKGNHRPDSDIDLSLTGKDLDLSLLLEIENAFDDLLLPYKTDLSIFHKIENPKLLDHINRVGIVFYQKTTPNE